MKLSIDTSNLALMLFGKSPTNLLAYFESGICSFYYPVIDSCQAQLALPNFHCQEPNSSSSTATSRVTSQRSSDMVMEHPDSPANIHQFRFTTMTDSNSLTPDVITIPITDSIDLHTFHPRDIKHLIPEYVHQCRQLNIHTVRIIHGKGTGAMQRTVHGILAQIPEVVNFSLASDQSGWGATIAELRPVQH